MKKPHRTIEDDLLLCCARTDLTPERADRIRRLLRSELDWDYLLGKSVAHAVYPLLYRNLKRIDAQAAPERVLVALKRRCRQNALNNLWLKEELLKILRAFDEHAIASMPIKGPFLAETAYGDLALRVFCDLDILIRKKDFGKAKELLQAIDYQPKHMLPRTQERIYLDSKCALDFQRWMGDRLMAQVDLHWDIASKFLALGLDPQHFWEGAERLDATGARAYQMSATNTVIFLSIHAWKEGWSQLKWLCDVSQFVASHGGRIDWDQILARAPAWRIERILYTTFYLVSDLLDARIPKDFLIRLGKSHAAKPLPRSVAQGLFPNDPKVLTGLPGYRFSLGFRDRMRDKLKFLSRILTTPTVAEFNALPLPARLTFLYWIIRPARLIFKYSCGLLGR